MVKEEQVKITVQVRPNAGQNRIIRFEGGVWHLGIAAPPTKGKANQELVRFLSGILGVTKDSLTVERGITSRRKVIAIRGLSHSQVMRQLEKPGV